MRKPNGKTCPGQDKRLSNENGDRPILSDRNTCPPPAATTVPAGQETPALDRVRATLAGHEMLRGAQHVIAAVSGGADSVCMLDMLRILAPEYGFTLIAAHYNHRLRGKESDGDEMFVKDLCAKMNIKIHCDGGNIAETAQEKGEGIEEMARTARYAFLHETAAEYSHSVIATAHTADDNAETVLLHLIRGAGLRGAGGIPPVRGRIIRPLIELSRAQVEQYCAARSLLYVTDSSNLEPVYARNRIRLEVMPILRQLNQGARDNLLRFARTARQADGYLLRQAQTLFETRHINGKLDITGLKNTPEFLRIYLFRLFLQAQFDIQGDSRLLFEIDRAVCTGQTGLRIQVPGGRFLELAAGYLLAAPACQPPPEPVPAGVGETMVFGEYTVCIEADRAYDRRYSIRASAFLRPVVLRTPRPGDRYHIPGVGHKLVSRLLIDRKVPKCRRAVLPLLEQDGKILWVAGIGVSAGFRAEKNEEFVNISCREKTDEK